MSAPRADRNRRRPGFRHRWILRAAKRVGFVFDTGA